MAPSAALLRVIAVASCGVILLILDMLFNKDSALAGKPDEKKDDTKSQVGKSDPVLDEDEKSAVSTGS